MYCPAGGDWYGVVAAFFGTVGALLLVRPLFQLLRHREAVESIAFALDLSVLEDDVRKEVSEAREELGKKIRKGRKNWKPWTYWAVVCLAVALLCIFAQAACLSG